MTVNLSMLAGAGAQFFDNNGNPLSGGLLYTYAAGTTTPQATYTTSAGNTAHANPIVLDSAGRVPSGGEIWLTDAASYKFVLKTGADVTIATYDALTGNGSGIYANLTANLAASSGSSLVGFIQSGTGAVQRTAQDKMRDVVSVKDFGAVGDGITDDTAAFNAMFATGSNVFELIAEEQYLIGGVNLPAGSGWTVEGNWSTIIPKAGALTCFTGTYTSQTYNIAIRNLKIQGDVTNVIKFVGTGNGVLLNCEISGITATSGTCATLVTLYSTATGQGETLKIKDILIFGADYDYVVYLYGGTSNYGSCEFKNIFHNGGSGVATIYAQDGLTLAKFDLIYHTRGSGIKCLAGSQFTHCQFERSETESVEHGTVLFDGNFENCSFDVSAIYNQALSSPFTEKIGSGVFKNCFLNNNFVYQRSGFVIDLASGSTRNTVQDLKIGSIDYVQYNAINDAGTFNDFVGEQYQSPVAATYGAVVADASYKITKDGRNVTLTVPATTGLPTAATYFVFGTDIPERYRPTSDIGFVGAQIIDNSSSQSQPGIILIMQASGQIRVYRSSDFSTNFTASGVGGLGYSATISWVI